MTLRQSGQGQLARNEGSPEGSTSLGGKRPVFWSCHAPNSPDKAFSCPLSLGDIVSPGPEVLPGVRCIFDPWEGGAFTVFEVDRPKSIFENSSDIFNFIKLIKLSWVLGAF